jgi:hypothetical protein
MAARAAIFSHLTRFISKIIVGSGLMTILKLLIMVVWSMLCLTVYIGLLPIFLVFLLVPETSFAYIDPGAGSLFIQLLLGGVAGFLVLMKLYWKRILEFFGKSKPEDPQTLTEKTTDPDA